MEKNGIITVEVIQDDPTPITKLDLITKIEYKPTALSRAVKAFRILSIVALCLILIAGSVIAVQFAISTTQALCLVVFSPFLIFIYIFACLGSPSGNNSLPDFLDSIVNSSSNLLTQAFVLGKIYGIILIVLTPFLITYLILSICGFSKEKGKYKKDFIASIVFASITIIVLITYIIFMIIGLYSLNII